MMASKTPVSILVELCAKHHQICDISVEEPDNSESGLQSKQFVCVAAAFGATAKGTGRSKRDAKHDACAKLIELLKAEECLQDDLSPIQLQYNQLPPDMNAVGILLDLCDQRNWHVLPTYEFEDSCGPSHAPEFTCVCNVGFMKRSATASNKKTAKQLAAQAMVDDIKQKIGESNNNE